MFSRAAVLLLCGALLGACGTAQESSVDEFSGEERRVAQVLADVSAAAGDADAARICSAQLTPQLGDRLKAGSRTCTRELEDALADADDYTLTTRDVAIDGTSATARVEDAQGRPRTVDLVRQGADWRIAAIRPG